MNEALIGTLVIVVGLLAEYLRRRWVAVDEKKATDQKLDILIAEEDARLNTAIRKGDHEVIRVIADARAARSAGMQVTPQK